MTLLDGIKIQLPSGGLAFVDSRNAYLASFKWFLNSRGYVCRNFKLPNGKWGRMKLHHAVIGYPIKKLEVDHVDGDKLNNRGSNLRLVTHRLNTHNIPQHRNKTRKHSPYVGVNFNRAKKKPWYAMITVNRKEIYLGTFGTPEEASCAYQKALKTVAE